MADDPPPDTITMSSPDGSIPPSPPSQSPGFGRNVLTLGLICLAVVGVALGAWHLLIQRQQKAAAAVGRVEHTHQVIAAINRVLADAEDTETGQRGFLLTGDTAYLEPYHQGHDAIWRHLAEARDLTADNPGQQDRLQRLETLLRGELAELTRTIELAQGGNKAGALDVVKTGEGRHLMNAARRLVADAVGEEERLLQERRARQQRLQHETARILVGLLLAATVGVGLGGAALARSYRTKATSKRAAVAEHERLLDIMDMAGIMVRDLDGTIRFWSEGCRRLYGWTAEEAVGQVSHALLQTVFPVPLAEIDAALARDGVWRGELQHRTRDGTLVTVAAHKAVRHEADGRLAVMENVTDITGLRQAEAELRQRQAELRSVLETAAEGIVVAHADGQIISVNRAAVRMFGYDAANELIGRDLGMLMPMIEAARHAAYIAAHRAGAAPRAIGVPGRELTAVRRDGSKFPIDLSVSSFGSAGQHCLVGIIRDATARKQAEAALRDNEARLRLVQAVGAIAYSDQELPGSTAVISSEFASLYGLPAGTTRITEAEWLAFVHPGDHDRIIAEGNDLMMRGGPLATEFRIRRADGAVRWIVARAEVFRDQDGRPLRLVSAQQDMTEIVAAREAQASRAAELERRVAERTAALAEAEARFRAIFDSQFQFMGLLDVQGTVLEVNRTALEAGGLIREDTIGRPWWQTRWWPAADRDRLRREIAEAAGGAMIRREVELGGANGRGIWIDFSLKPVRDDATGQIKWIITEGRDLTDLRNISAQLAQSQKVQALGQLASGIAHDFNNILQAVEGAATLIERRPDDHDRTRRLARMTIDATGRGGSITQRLLSFARRGEVRTEALPTAELLANICEVLAHTLGTAIVVQSKVPSDVPRVVADRGQLETALVNLGTNARDAMPSGGILTLSAEPVDSTDSDDHPAGLAPGAYVRLSVSDTGTGMDAATLAQATEAFFTTKPPGQGTGLGLPMVKALAEQSGGAMTIASTPGAGTTVTLWLPRAKDERIPVANETDGRRTALEASARILLVDDDVMVRETLAAQLEDLGFGIVTASGGAEAIALLEGGEAVSALVSDLSMPEMDGVTTIGKARTLRPEMPCFLLTGYVGERAALAAGDTFTLISKPVSAQALAARIEASLEVAAG